jgi:hypothetical protein
MASLVTATPPASQPSPEASAEPAPEPRHLAAANDDLLLSNLSADVAIGRVRTVVLAGLSQSRDAAVIADRLVTDALRVGLSVCRIDAGSGRVTEMAGITDLCAERASFGDVVHKVSDGLAEVPWGTLQSLERRSMRPVTLIEALSDIYEVVIVATGRVGLGSNLPVFAGVKARLVLVRHPGSADTVTEAISAEISALGFDGAQAVAVPEPQAAVA